MKYEKPVIIVTEEFAEGVYTASGGNIADNGCASIYMNGEHKSAQTTIMGNEYKMIDRGCEGCPADQGGQCRLDLGPFGSSLMPTWERNGLDPNSNFIYWG